MKTAERQETQRLNIAAEVDKIMRERTPSPEDVIYTPTVTFLDPGGRLTREERCKVIAMGDRTAKSYKSLAVDVIASRNAPPVEVDGEMLDATTAFFLRYALVARGKREIAHTSVLEQMNVGPREFGGDPPIVIEGITGLAGYRDICSLRHFAFEAFSTRGAIFPEGYWRIPEPLERAGAGQRLREINQEVYNIYIALTRAGVAHYLQALERGPDEKRWEYRWRVLSHALDDARQVTNQSWLCHLAIHPNNAQALREAIVKLGSSEFPETRAIAGRARVLAGQGLPTFMRHTEPSPYQQGLPEKRRLVAARVGLLDGDGTDAQEKLRFVNFWVSGLEAERVFLAAFVAKDGKSSFDKALYRIQRVSEFELNYYLSIVLGDMDFHDKPPDELDMIQVNSSFVMSVGAIYELIRHRLATHIFSEFTVNHGYTVPVVYREIGTEDLYIRAMGLNEEGYRLVESLGEEYAVYKPLFVSRGHLNHITVRASGADLFHLLKLRADQGAHPDLRDPMYQLEAALRKEMPVIFGYLVKK